MHAFVGADRDRPLDRASAASSSAGSGCSTSVTPAAGAGGEVLGEIAGGPALVGVDDQLGLRRGRAAPRRCARGRPAPPSLILSSGRDAAARGRARHRLRVPSEIV